MNATQPKAMPKQPAVIVTLAHLLERLERSSVAVSAEQYRTVVRHLAEELSRATSDATLQAVLDAHPAAAELYENINYQHAGLCRSPLEFSLAAELAAKAVLQRAAQSAHDVPRR